uniref:Glycoside hydrolase N-terminal domain-containing protein n=1 Tax=Roseihalotalea indica TaxID=2867963 RepID=A0AA49GP68_9BACT|nr:glycoside hydrolase N-terminal domain-containing protein [Tunicatimonas sp. TK19036]
MKHCLTHLPKVIFLGLLLLAACSSETMPPQQTEVPDTLRLWYDAPAEDWMREALPFGNGYMGAMYFGTPQEEHIQFTEESLWTGGAGANEEYHYGIRENAHQYLPQVRALLKEGRLDEAHQLASKEMAGVIHEEEGSGQPFGDFGAQQTMGDLYVQVAHKGAIQEYQRALSLSEGVARVHYTVGGIRYQRQFFGNYPKRVLVYHFASTDPEGTDYHIRLETPHQKIAERFENSTYTFEGKVADNGMAFETLYRVISPEGTVRFDQGEVVVEGASSLTLVHTAATDYLPQFPDYKGRDYQALNRKTMAGVEGLTKDVLFEEHKKDYQSLFQRVALHLGENTADSLPTDQRQKAYFEGNDDPALEALYFQYGRYLMISGSRPGTLPLNLQGKWNNSTSPPWANDYHMNINEQMLYWPAEVTNLPECHEPLLDYLGTLVEPGKLAAKAHFNTRGWVVNTMNNAFGFTAPGWGFPWGFYPGGAAWLCQHLWEHYAFTQDQQYLKNTAYPIMKEAALFWIDYLTEDESGYLVSSPSYSPEHGGISTGASMDHQMAWDLLNNCVAASQVLGVDDEFREQAAAIRDRIYPPQVGQWGQLQEWKEDVDDPENHHRHVSHLFALHPGKQITVAETPKLAEAAKVSLNARGDGGTGWSLAWKVSFWARLKDGDRAHKLLKNVLAPVISQETDYNEGSGSYNNLLCAHPPFQLDGNMGSTAGMAEMLMQSHTEAIELLPALPEVWKNGRVAGLKARGNFELALHWEDHKLSGGQVLSLNGGPCTIRYQGKQVEIDTEAGETYDIVGLF